MWWNFFSSSEKIKDPEKEQHNNGKKSPLKDDDLFNPLTQAKAAAKRLGLTKLLSHLNCTE